MLNYETLLFDKCIEKIKFKKKINKKKYLKNGKFPIVSQEDQVISGFWNNAEDVYKIDKPVIIFGDHTRVIKYIDFDFVVGADGTKIIKTKPNIIPKYFYYFLFSANIKSLGYSRHYKLLKKLKINLPPLPIQEKIVAKLDKIFTEIDKVIALTESKTKNLENFFNSYFLFLKTKNHSNWKKKTIGQLCNLMTGGTPSKKEKKYYQNGNIPWLVSGDINLDIINDCKGRITELGLKNSNAKFLPINSVIIALNGQGKTRGTVAILNMKATCNQSLVSIVPKDPNEIKSRIIYYILKSRYNEIRKLTGDSGNDRRGLNMQIIRKIELFYPSKLSEQNEIIKSSNLILLKLKKINEINLIKINELQLLKQSILKQAFNGELAKAA